MTQLRARIDSRDQLQDALSEFIKRGRDENVAFSHWMYTDSLRIDPSLMDQYHEEMVALHNRFHRMTAELKAQREHGQQYGQQAFPTARAQPYQTQQSSTIGQQH